MSRATILPSASAGAARERVVADHARVDSDWYVDSAWCTELLLNAVDFVGAIWDPCCGSGTIPKTIARCGNITNGYGGSDLVYRGYGEGGINCWIVWENEEGRKPAPGERPVIGWLA